MQHPRLLNSQARSPHADHHSLQSSEVKQSPAAYGSKLGGGDEQQQVHQIVTTRGEGLADLLMMKREFERHITKFTKLTRRVEEIEKGNSFIRNLDLEAMVTPGGLEEKVRMEINFVETKLENMRTSLMNNLELRCKEVTDTSTALIQERVSKKEYLQNKTFMLELIRETKSTAKQAMSQTDNLQTKYENLNDFYASKDEFDELKEKYR